MNDATIVSAGTYNLYFYEKNAMGLDGSDY